ncbi:MAG TPA: hypothetical protein VEM76_13375, partial [Anaeromyxobacteraceae bacterium]|nr:hypothetical protein [Anaeromyxobacteraceae bacterium]
MRETRGGSAAFTARLAIAAAGVALVAWSLSADAHWAERHVLGAYCATNVATWVLARGMRWLAGALGLGLVAASALARRLGSTSLRARAGSLVGIALAVAASLGVTELYMRRLHGRLHGRLSLGAQATRAIERDAPMTRVDPRLGWSYFPGRTTWVELGERRIAYAIDADGDRAASAGELSDPARPTVLFSGESIAFGYGLAYEETFPFLVGRGLGVQIANLAVIGFGNDQAYLRVLDALARYRRPLAVVTLFVPDQIKRNADVWRPRLALGPDGALTLVAPSTGPRITRLLQQLPYRGGEALRVTAAILRATAEAARARGAFPLFVVTNYGRACKREDGEEAWVVDELFARQGLPFVRVDLGSEDRLPGLFEDHPNPRGARAIAAAVERALRAALTSSG